MLKKSRQGRVINVTAHAYSAGKMCIDDPLGITNLAPQFHPRDAYAHSKFAINLWTRKLATLLASTQITVNCATPGLVRGTNHMRHSLIMRAKSCKLLMLPWIFIFMKTPAQGAQTVIHLATDDKIKSTSGEYFKWVKAFPFSPLKRAPCSSVNYFPWNSSESNAQIKTRVGWALWVGSQLFTLGEFSVDIVYIDSLRTYFNFQGELSKKKVIRNFSNFIWIVAGNSLFVFRVVVLSFELLCNFNNYSGIFAHFSVSGTSCKERKLFRCKHGTFQCFFGWKHNVLIMSSRVDTLDSKI